MGTGWTGQALAKLRTVPAVVGQDPFADPGAAMNVPPGVDASRTNTAPPSIET